MRLPWQAKSNALTWWWGMLTLVSGVNIALWFWLYRALHQPVAGPGGTIGIPNDGTKLISITSNTIKGASAANLMGGSAIIVAVQSVNSGSRSQANFNISSNGTVANPVTNIGGTVIGVGCNGYTTLAATVNNNVIVANHVPNLGGPIGIGGGSGAGGAGVSSTPAMTITVTNNNISQTDGNVIGLFNRANNGSLNLKIASNTCTTPLNAGGTARQCIRVDSGNATAGEDTTVCLNITGNTCQLGSNGAAGIGIREDATPITCNTSRFVPHYFV